MATDLPRFTITLPEDVYQQVSEYKEAQKISTQSKAIQRLIVLGLQEVAGPHETHPAEPVDIEAGMVAKDFGKLDQHGRKVVRLVIDAEAERMASGEGQQRPADLGMIRLYYSRIAAGVSGFTEDDYEDIPRTSEMPSNADFCLLVSGDSMEPYIHDGEMIFISESLPVADYDVGAFSVDGVSVVKQYRRNTDGSVDLLSANPARKDANIHIGAESDSTLECWGRVILPKKLPAPVYE